MADQDQPDNKPEEQARPEEPEQEPQVEPKEELEPEEKAIAEPQEPEQDEPEEPEEQPEAEPEQEDKPEGMSRRKAKRLEKLEGLVERLKGKPQQSQPENNSQKIDYRKLIEADDEVYENLDKASQDFGNSQYQAGLDQANSVRFHTRLEIDAPRVESKYSQFNKESSDFNPGLASAVNDWYLATVGYDPQSDTVQNPNVRYSDFVEGIMDLADAMAGEKASKSTRNIAKQASNAGLRPDGSSAKPLNLNKAPEDMNEAELNAAIKANMPRDARGRFTS